MKSKQGKVVLTSAYFPPIEYFVACLKAESVLVEKWESYNKQSYRNRTIIAASDGKLSLVVPIDKDNIHKPLITQVKIDYSKPWLQQHKRALVAAYQNSPFYEYYCDDLYEILDQKFEYLFDLNESLLAWCFKVLGFQRTLSNTSEFLAEYQSDVLDLRYSISPKKNNIYQIEKPYYQVFTPKQGFISNLSILDLIFNEGPESIRYLRNY